MTIAVRPRRRTLQGQSSIGLDRFRTEAEVLRFMAQVGLAQKAALADGIAPKRSSDSPNQFAEIGLSSGADPITTSGL